ncbi:MAG: SDR family NAD(P)-dependent oxidoreductase [Lachnospiraceae bacterium]|nr:SDR family NAD(P)-dependent oxidoreductase [Lachnospiraceae bacterium]
MLKIAFVSGASRGIGRAIATALAEKGYHLSITCEKNEQLLTDLADELAAKYHVRVLTFVGNMGDSTFVSKVAKETLSKFGQMDVIINNAGISYVGLLTDMTDEEWNRILSVNLSSCFYTSRAFLPSMVARQRGSIINISSMWGRVGASCEVAYSASKGGIHAFTQALAKELAPSHISVNAIACGVIDTDMNAFLSEEDAADLAADIPAGRFAETKEVAQTVLSLLDSPYYLTGQIIGLDGGYI